MADTIKNNVGPAPTNNVDFMKANQVVILQNQANSKLQEALILMQQIVDLQAKIVTPTN